MRMLRPKEMRKRELGKNTALVTDLENPKQEVWKEEKMNVIKFEVLAGHLIIMVLNIQEKSSEMRAQPGNSRQTGSFISWVTLKGCCLMFWICSCRQLCAWRATCWHGTGHGTQMPRGPLSVSRAGVAGCTLDSCNDCCHCWMLNIEPLPPVGKPSMYGFSWEAKSYFLLQKQRRPRAPCPQPWQMECAQVSEARPNGSFHKITEIVG